MNGHIGGPTPGTPGAAESLVISNNRISGNQGYFGGGIRLGHPELIVDDVHVDAHNYNIKVRHNLISQNGGINGAGGGVSIHTGADNYAVTNNYIVGNFTSGEGAGIGHLGWSDNGLIENNTIAYNQSFNQMWSVSGGGILIAGKSPIVGLETVSPGSGSVTVTSNRIQGNQAGAGDGGGIALRYTNNALITINDNMIDNNITGLAGGGISLQDAANVSITDSTIAHNDSTATASPAFTVGPLTSTQQPAGIVSRAHVTALTGTFSNPVTFTGNIIWKNRTFTWDGGLQPDISAGGTPVYWDLGVLGAVGQMNPTAGILTSLTGLDGVTYDGSNSTADPSFTEAFFNGARGALILPEPTTGIQTAIAFDEGGNFIDLRFGPLSLVGDYTSTSGVGAAGTVGALAFKNSSVSSDSGESGGGCFIGAMSSRGVNYFTFLTLVLAAFVFWAVMMISQRIFSKKTSGLKHISFIGLFLLLGLFIAMPSMQAGARVVVQCPGDVDGDAIPDAVFPEGHAQAGEPNPDYDPDVVCRHMAAGDGFINMADGRLQYIFGFSDVTGVPENEVMMVSMLG
ncbi:MAG: right-handed parallel beta-helix repeat-containing protein, partial [Deltaproteobacteria bacterium]|nr:right-handed parallel beta-helix repeat-containing protein [Deltaproteobacteria bacterium]